MSTLRWRLRRRTSVCVLLRRIFGGGRVEVKVSLITAEQTRRVYRNLIVIRDYGAVSIFGRYRPYWDSIVGACYVARTLLYAGLSSFRRPGTCIMGRGTDCIYPLGRLKKTCPCSYGIASMFAGYVGAIIGICHRVRTSNPDLTLLIPLKP